MALNWKSLAAIALLVIVVTPIGLGYLMASDTHEKTTYETSTTHNLSDYILNHQSPYYGDYSGSTNNHAIITEALNQGSWGETINSPDYAQVSDNPSSLPIQTWTDHDYAVETGTDTFSESDNYTVGYNDPFPTHHTWNEPFWTFSCAAYGYWDLTLYDSSGSGDVIYYGYPTSQITATYVDSHGRQITFEDANGPQSFYTDFWVQGILGNTPSTYSWTTWNTLEISDDEYLVSGLLLAGVIKEEHYPFYEIWPTSYAYVTEDTISVGGHDYPRDEYDVVVVPPFGSSYISYRTPSFSGTYGDPAYGWTLPDIGSPQSRVDYWSNNQINIGITIYATLDDNEWLGIQPANQVSTSTDASLRVYRVNGMTYVDQDSGSEAQPLGRYANVQIKVTKESYVVTGITAWPAMYGPISALNAITIDRATSTFTMLKLLQFNGSEIYWRVDNAVIYMGEYSTTLDATLNLSQIFPGKSMALTMNSVAVYGDQLAVGGTQQVPYYIPVENGRITVAGQTFPLKGSLWMWTLEDGFYTLTINGYHVTDRTDHLAAAGISYLGEWSTIITGYTVTPVTGIVTEWVPGAFAFDQNSMAAAAMIAAVGAFIILGLTGRSSLPKAGILALVCGGAVCVFLLLT